MNVRQTAAEIIAKLRACTDSERRGATANYYPSAQENLGVYAADIRRIVREYRTALKIETPETVLKQALAIIALNTLEGRQVAYELVGGHKAAMAALRLHDVEALGKGMDNWASVDGFSCGISGHTWRDGQIKDADIHRWARSADPWWRRAALVSTVPLNLVARGGKGDAPRTLRVCKLLADDDHIMVHKALSWALRSLIQHDRSAVAAFIRKHNSLPALVRREVNNKLKSGLKNPKT